MLEFIPAGHLSPLKKHIHQTWLDIAASRESFLWIQETVRTSVLSFLKAELEGKVQSVAASSQEDG